MKTLRTLAVVAALVSSSSLVAKAISPTMLSSLTSSANQTFAVGMSYQSVAQQFTTGPHDALVNGVRISTGAVGAGSLFNASFYSDNGGYLGSQITSLSGAASPAANSQTMYSASSLTLSANTSYWVVFQNNFGTDVNLYNTSGGTLNTTTSDSWTFGKTGVLPTPDGLIGGYTYYDAGVTPVVMAVHGVAVPEPSTFALLGLGAIGLLGLRLRNRE